MKALAVVRVFSARVREVSGQRVSKDGSPIPDPSGDSVTEAAATTNPSHPVELGDLVEPRTRVPAQLADDAQLIAACRRGEARAMEMLYHQYKRRVFGMAHRIVGASDAEEVAQEVFVRVFRGLAAFRGDSQLSTWVYRLTVNASLSHLARRGRRQEVSDEVLTEHAAPPVAERDPSLAARIEAALSQLPAGYRAILVLHDVEGLSHEECAAILDCRVGTCKSQLHKARARMRELLGSVRT
jgi:RNA polymerase sigma-70 factor (ECF subfamily)